MHKAKGKAMKKLSLLLLFSLTHLVPTNIQPMEKNEKKQTIEEFFGIEKPELLSSLSSSVKNIINKKIINDKHLWYMLKEKPDNVES